MTIKNINDLHSISIRAFNITPGSVVHYGGCLYVITGRTEGGELGVGEEQVRLHGYTVLEHPVHYPSRDLGNGWKSVAYTKEFDFLESDFDYNEIFHVVGMNFHAAQNEPSDTDDYGF